VEHILGTNAFGLIFSMKRTRKRSYGAKQQTNQHYK